MGSPQPWKAMRHKRGHWLQQQLNERDAKQCLCRHPPDLHNYGKGVCKVDVCDCERYVAQTNNEGSV